MDRIKSITFDKEAQNALPKHIKDKMRADRKEAEAKQLLIPRVSNCVCKNPETEHIHGLIKICIKCGKKA